MKSDKPLPPISIPRSDARDHSHKFEVGLLVYSTSTGAFLLNGPCIIIGYFDGKPSAGANPQYELFSQYLLKSFRLPAWVVNAFYCLV